MRKAFKTRKEIQGIEDPTRFNVWIESGSVDFLKHYALDNHTTAGEIIRSLVRDFVTKQKKKETKAHGFRTNSLTTTTTAFWTGNVTQRRANLIIVT